VHADQADVEDALAELDSVIAGAEEPEARFVRRAAEVSQRHREELAAGPTDPGPPSRRIGGFSWLTAKDEADADYRPPHALRELAAPVAAASGAEAEPAPDDGTSAEPDLHPSQTSPATANVIDQLRGLGELQEAGVISAEEFEAAKRQLLARL
jgi:Short C-terminal domain